MTAACGPDRFSVSAPSVASQPPPAALKYWLERLRIDWRKEQATRTETPDANDIDRHDRWLAQAWEDYVRLLLQNIPGFFLVRAGGNTLEAPPAIVPERLLGLRDNRIVETGGSVSRSAMAGYLLQYYWPCTDANTLKPWLPQLVTTASGFRAAGIGTFQFPEAVDNLENVNDRRILEQLESSMRPSIFRRRKAPLLEPVAPEPPDPAPGEERTPGFRARLQRFDEQNRAYQRDFKRFDAARQEWQRERARAEASVRDPRVDLARKRRAQKLPSVRRISVLGIPIDRGVLPSNLFLSQIAPFIEPYLSPLQQLDRTFGSAYVSQAVVAWFYFLIGMGLIPNWRHWRLHWGTSVIEDLLPAELEGLAVTRQWVERQMVEQVRGAADDARRGDGSASLISDDFLDAEQRLLEGVRTVSLQYLDAVLAQWSAQLRFCVEEQGGGRVQLDPVTFTAAQPWRLKVNRSGADPLSLSFPEHIMYASGLDHDVRWMLRAAWPQVRSVTALCNQAGVHLRINAGNNRWGGRHPPHSSHKQGTDVDWDLGLAGDWVPNLLQRQGQTDRPFSHLFRNEPLEGGDAGPPCQIGIDRLVMWIGVQANIIAGVRALLYGDEPLLHEATRHLTSLFNVRRPAHASADPEPRAHHNHLHADYLPHAVQNCADPLVWALADVDDLAARLYTLAMQRDADVNFWRKFAGLEAVPTTAADFDALRQTYRRLAAEQIQRQIRAWKTFWSLRETHGIALLPVWNPVLALDTRDALVCGIGRVVQDQAPV